VRYELFIDLNDGCNIKCTMCGGRVAPSRQKEIPLSEFPKIIALIKHSDTFQLGCQCEPSVVSYLHLAVQLLQKAHVPQGMFVSNFVRINPWVADQLVSSKVFKRIWASFDGATKETFEKIRVGAIYERVLENIKRVVAVPTYLIITLQEGNLHELPDLVKLASDIGAKGVRYHRLYGHETKTPPEANRYNAVITQAERVASDLKLEMFGARYGVLGEKTAGCVAPPRPTTHILTLDANGDIKEGNNTLVNLFCDPWTSVLARLTDTSYA